MERYVERSRSRRLVLAGVAVALACGFAVERPGERSGASALATPISLPNPPPPLVPASGATIDPPMPPSAIRRSRTHERLVPPSPDSVAARPRSFGEPSAALAWRSVHGAVDGTLWHSGERTAASVHGLDGIDFPALARARRSADERVYRPLVSWRESTTSPDGREPIPHVRCMGLSPEAVARRAARYEERIMRLAAEQGVGASLVNAVIAAESCFDPQAISRVGALGLMQLMPATAAWLGAEDPLDPNTNLRAGIRYLASLERRFGDTALALAAYNAGPTNVRRYGGIPPFGETRHYVKQVLAHQRRYAAATALAAR